MSDCHFGVSPVNYPDPDQCGGTNEPNGDTLSIISVDSMGVNKGEENQNTLTGKLYSLRNKIIYKLQICYQHHVT